MNEYYEILQRFLSKRQKEIIKAFAENNMNATETAKSLYMHRNAVIYHIGEIKRKTGLNARRFYDLLKLLEIVGDNKCQKDGTERTTPN